MLRLYGLGAIADRLNYHHGLAVDDPDEQTIAVGSMKELALFLMSEQKLPDPQIGISPAGFAHAEWQVGERGILAMEFLPCDGLTRFAAISAPPQRGVQRIRVHGTLPKDHTLSAVCAIKTEARDC